MSVIRIFEIISLNLVATIDFIYRKRIKSGTSNYYQGFFETLFAKVQAFCF